MFTRILLAGLAGGLTVFMLSAVQNIILPAGAPRSLPHQEGVLPVLRASIPDAGFYFFPGEALTRDMTGAQRELTRANYERRFREGPAGVLVYAPGGSEFRFGRRLAVQLALSLIAAMMAAAVLARCAGPTTYAGRVSVILAFGAFAFVYLEPQYWNWYGFPASYTLARVGAGILSWALAGLPMAAIVHGSK